MDFYFLPCGWVASFLLRLFVVAISVLGQAGPNPPRLPVDPPSRDSAATRPSCNGDLARSVERGLGRVRSGLGFGSDGAGCLGFGRNVAEF